MVLTGKQYSRIAVEFIHDVALGAFPGTVLGAWLVRRGVESQGLGGGAIARASSILWLVFLLGVAIAVATGTVRLRYWKLNVVSEALETKAQMVATKHVFFVLLLLGSAAGLYLVQRG